MEARRKMRVKLTRDQAIYIHNDLGNAALYFKNRVAERMKEENHYGVFHEMLAAITMTAFAMEANVNLIGSKVLGADWNERENYWGKLRRVLATIGINADFQTRPYSSIQHMQELRDALAHGKPERVTDEQIVVGFYDELEGSAQRQPGSWEVMVTLANVAEWFDDMQAIWDQMLAASGIQLFDTMDQGLYGMEFIEYVDE